MADPLATLIAGDGIVPTRSVAVGPQGVVTWEQFHADVRHREGHIAALPPGAVAIHQPDPCEFLACLWATWRLGRIAVISASGFRDLAHRLASPMVDGACVTAFDAAALPTDMPSDTALVLFTSGSSGAPQPVPKSLAQLDAEIALIDALWGDSLTDTLVVNLVSHHHMFGLPFGLLWPLARGTVFHTRTIHYPEPLEDLARDHRLTLVCSPVHLQHLPDKLDPATLSGRIVRVFSAGVALEENAAVRCQSLFGKAVTEIYGSTETGATAWRTEPAGPWQCLPGITVDHPPEARQRQPHQTELLHSELLHSEFRQLRIHSPALPDGPLVVADLGEIHSPTTFTLGGRTDRIAKVGGKRVSLTALEKALLDHPWVEDVRLVPLAERNGRLGAVVILDREGNAALVDRGRKTVSDRLKAHIAGPVEPIVLPRYWRYVAKMPMNSQGKVTTDTLVDLFVNERQSRFPVLLDSEELIAGSHCRLTLRIPDNLFYFNGHFPGNPVLPGVVQTHWVIHYARQRFTGLDEFAGLEALKFQHIIQPGAVVTLDLQWQPERSKLHFSYQSPHARHSSGRVLFTREGRHDG